jgi:hypothetical protein
MGLQAAVHLGHAPWALTKEEEEDEENHMNSIHKHIHSNVSPSWLLKHTKHPTVQRTIQQRGTLPTSTFIQNADHNTAW